MTELTRSTPIEVSSQGNLESMKTYRVDSDVACNDWILQFVTHNCVSICVSIKNLDKENSNEFSGAKFTGKHSRLCAKK